MKKFSAFIFLAILIATNFNLDAKFLKSRNGLVEISELFAPSNIFKDENFITSDPEGDVLNLLDSTYVDVRQALLDRNIVGLDFEDQEVLYFFQDLSPLVYQVSSFDEFGFVESNEKQVLYSLFSKTACNFVTKMDLEQIAKSFPKVELDSIRNVKDISDNDDMIVYVKEILESENKDVAEIFIKDFFSVLFCHLTLEINQYVDSVSEKLLLSDQTKFSLFRKKRRRQTAVAIFQALANACMQASQLVGKQNQQGILGLFGTIFHLTSQVIADDPENLNGLDEQTKMRGIEMRGIEMRSIGQKILSSKLFQKLASTILICLQEYVHEKLEELLDYLCNKILALVLGDNVQTDVDSIGDDSCDLDVLENNEDE